ncbi:MAG TPA: hypothetical protein VFS43_04395 [Polyangiaceae bacterium]|nr:hypothetical protein [Polyangiaceae bacterium]
MLRWAKKPPGRWTYSGRTDGPHESPWASATMPSETARATPSASQRTTRAGTASEAAASEQAPSIR